jgi:hypothetical protein
MESAGLGECNYYLKARFPTAAQAAAALPRMCDLLAQGEAAYEYWQNSRPSAHEEEPGWQLPSPEVFWGGFRERFPLVYRYLQELAGTPDWNNDLAGQLSCMVDPRDSRTIDPRASLVREGDILLLKLSGIWHYAEMGLLERYCLEDIGAVAVGSISEEDFEWDEDEDEDEQEGPEDWELFEAIEL